MNTLKNIILILFIILSTSVLAQVKDPGDPDGAPTGETPVGGGAPVGSGLAILLTLGSFYGSYKIKIYKKNMEKL